MNVRDFVALVLLEWGGEVQGKTKLQKLVYFVGALANHLDKLGYRPHFYGPYSDEVAYAVGQLKAIGALDQNATDWGHDRSGFEVKRYDYRLTEAGRRYAQGLEQWDVTTTREIREAVQKLRQVGDPDYITLSIAAKTYYLLGQKPEPALLSNLVQLASRFGWNVGPSQIEQAAEFLHKIGLIELEKPASY
ncbi:MAG: hypothetical protein KatS3mg082_1983 [Nitrospiraceae bacterium]|jgi:uncharacterized protein YwgA|nr:MAG: hypothetical protein KatS3mg082_1983 [Nitrospiraceae bacterium]